jgi:hypothetical protein
MKQYLLALALAATFPLPLTAHAQAATKSAAAPAIPDVKTFDQRLAEAQQHMKQMQEQMVQIGQATDPQERQKLLQEHYASMQRAMTAMHGMWGPGMMGACCAASAPMMGGPGMMHGAGMMGWSDMRGYYTQLTPEQLKQRQYMMDQYMGMQQTMMDHMMWRQQWMAPPPGPAK